MVTHAIAYVATALAFLAIDAVWLTAMGNRFYKPLMGDMVLEGFRPLPALVFYLIYTAGIIIFAVSPALDSGRWTTALTYGALFGFFCYATYDLTNQATLKSWPVALTIVDITWGTVLTAASATLGYLITRWAQGVLS
ncbi:DUF2177 family protein [Xanthobacteraceae bacterium A53D]